MKKFNKKQVAILKEYWKAAQKLRDRYNKEIQFLETNAQKKLGIQIELYHCDGSLVGIGDYNRNYELLHDTDLD